mgnify:CR=1 FL=1
MNSILSIPNSTLRLHRSWQSCGIQIESLRSRFDTLGNFGGTHDPYCGGAKPDQNETEMVELNKGRASFT